ncbi:type II toxin-antitoxin system VapC family toxin [Candidatus Curtissbacteria bacterium]|nr:type II toxin-antitoxin system VapC family toxin [Candidatus Curtissbacteria bacterium]
MFLLDTDILIWILRGKKDVKEKVSKLKEKSPLAISVISIAEIFRNVFPSELSTTEDFLNQHIIFNLDQKTAKIGGLYCQQYSKQLKNLTLDDCLIAGCANVNDLELVSLNTKHFPMQDIKTLNPLR